MSSQSFLLAVVLLAIGTFALRYSFLASPGAARPSRRLRRLLEATPAATMCAIAAPILARGGETALDLDPVKIGAGAVTLAVGGVTRNFLAALLSGVAAALLIGWFV